MAMHHYARERLEAMNEREANRALDLANLKQQHTQRQTERLMVFSKTKEAFELERARDLAQLIEEERTIEATRKRDLEELEEKHKVRLVAFEERRTELETVEANRRRQVRQFERELAQDVEKDRLEVEERARRHTQAKEMEEREFALLKKLQDDLDGTEPRIREHFGLPEPPADQAAERYRAMAYAADSPGKRVDKKAGGAARLYAVDRHMAAAAAPSPEANGSRLPLASLKCSPWGVEDDQQRRLSFDDDSNNTQHFTSLQRRRQGEALRHSAAMDRQDRAQRRERSYCAPTPLSTQRLWTAETPHLERTELMAMAGECEEAGRRSPIRPQSIGGSAGMDRVNPQASGFLPVVLKSPTVPFKGLPRMDVSGDLWTEPELRALFNKMDKKGKGVIQRADFKAMIREMEDFGVPITDERLERWMRMGSILPTQPAASATQLTFDEFAVLMLRRTQL